MSKHIFTVEVEVDSDEGYEQAVSRISAIGEITDEESDFSV